MFRNFVAKLLALTMLLGFVGVSIFVFHAIPLYGAEISVPQNDTVVHLVDPHLYLPLLQDDSQSVSDASCRSCHGSTEAVVELPSGESFSAHVDMELLAASAHGDAAGDPLLCTSCHAPAQYQFPHDEIAAGDLRAYEMAQSTACERCHVEPHLTGHPGPEAENPVVCTDCHGSHEVLTVEQLHAGDGTDKCISCHAEAGVDLVEADSLNQLINSGLFAQQEINNDYCLSCHSQPDISVTFANGETRSATVDAMALHDSVHGVSNSWDSLLCTDCHIDYQYPHEPLTVETPREYSVEQNLVCKNCHEQKFSEALDSVHGAALMDGNLEAATCTDCHGAHNTSVPNEPRQKISLTCEQCHTEIYNEYIESVHGEALLTGDPDVPTCIDCHGVHNIGDPTTVLFRVRSPELCASCHANEEMMARHDISTDVFNTYVSDFHGTTTMLFDPEHANADPTKAVCYDCHGVHDIKAPDDPEAGIKQNLVETCRKCHPDASANFSDSWTSHFVPSLQHNTLVYLVNLFYQIVIPATVGVLGFLVMTDIYRRVRTRLNRKGAEDA
ncbi:MAG: cytochrome c3 family protein [Candidatus Promineifilaceae bacterium]